jgi:hypothetical protein
MPKVMRQQTREARKPRKRHLWRGGAALGLCACLGAFGCSSTGSSTAPSATAAAKSNDPFFGATMPPPPQANDPVKPAPQAPPTQSAQNPGWTAPTQQAGGVPPIPSQLSGASVASMAPLPNTKQLSIGETPSIAIRPSEVQFTNGAKTSPPPQPWGGAVQPTGGAGNTAPPRVMPIPQDNSSTATWSGNGSTPPNLPPPPAASGPTSEMLDQRLKERGVVGQKQEPVNDGIRLTCSVIPANDPGTLRFYTVTAANYVAAAQAILQQMDQK